MARATPLLYTQAPKIWLACNGSFHLKRRIYKWGGYMEQTWVRSMLLCIGYYLVGVLWYGLFACRPWLICVIPAHCGWCSERLISALEEANIRSWHTAYCCTVQCSLLLRTLLHQTGKLRYYIHCKRKTFIASALLQHYFCKNQNALLL